MGGTAAFGKKQARPNVVMVSVDDMNDWVGCLKPVRRFSICIGPYAGRKFLKGLPDAHV